MRVAIQGERGSFSHKAAMLLVPEHTSLQACVLSAEVFERLAGGEADAAVVPIENSLAGSVLEHYDLLLAHPVEITAELPLRIQHCLIAAAGVRLQDVREVYSHPVALAQCRCFFRSYPALQARPFYDTAGAVASAVKAGGPAAAIAGEHAAREYGGEILQAGIEDDPANYTRFFLLRRQGSEAALLPPGAQLPEADKVSLAFGVANQPGALVEALQIFARHGLNLSRIESRPVPGAPWQYVFYTDYQVTAPEQAALALAELATYCSFVKQLGQYRAAPASPIS